MFDTLIRGGAVVDGTGRPAFAADVAVSGGRIAGILPASEPSEEFGMLMVSQVK